MKLQMPVINCPHEQVAGHLADGHTRVTRKPSVCLVGPEGFANAVPAMLEAGGERSPVIFVTGSSTLKRQGAGGFKEIDDVAIATPDLMGLVGPLGRVLGPRGLMPSPKAGTVTSEVAATVKEYKAGKIEFRVDKFGIVHAVVGKLSFDETQLVENAEALIRMIESMRPSSAKGTYIRTLTLSATMTPGITVAA